MIKFRKYYFDKVSKIYLTKLQNIIDEVSKILFWQSFIILLTKFHNIIHEISKYYWQSFGNIILTKFQKYYWQSFKILLTKFHNISHEISKYIMTKFQHSFDKVAKHNYYNISIISVFFFVFFFRWWLYAGWSFRYYECKNWAMFLSDL